MAAKDYKICCALASAYIAKTSKRNPNMMLEDRKEIEEGEILMLIDWYLNNEVEDDEHGLTFKSLQRKGYKIEMKFVKDEE